MVTHCLLAGREIFEQLQSPEAEPSEPRARLWVCVQSLNHQITDCFGLEGP